MICHEEQIYYSLNEIAPMCLYSPDYLRVLIHQGRLQGAKFNGAWHVTLKCLQEYRSRHGETAVDHDTWSTLTNKDAAAAKVINLDKNIPEAGRETGWRMGEAGNDFISKSPQIHTALQGDFRSRILITFSRDGTNRDDAEKRYESLRAQRAPRPRSGRF